MNKKLKKHFFWFILVSLFFRITILFLFLPFYQYLADDIHMERISESLLKGYNPYIQEWDRGGSYFRISYSHPPAWMIYSFFIKKFSIMSNISWNILYRFPFLIVDVMLNVFIFYLIVEKKNEFEAKFIGWLYALNPITPLATVFLAHPSIIIMFFVILSWYFLHISKGKKLFMSAFMFFLAVSWKILPLILLPVMLFKLPKWKQRFKYFFIVSGLLGLSFLPFIFNNSDALFAIIKYVFLYFGSGESWGINLFLEIFYTFSSWLLVMNLQIVILSFQKLIFIIPLLSVYYLIYKKKCSLLESIYVVLLTFIVFRMVMALQHFAWFVPLFFLIERKNFPLLIFSSFSVIFGLVHFAVKGNFIRFLSFNFSMWLMYVFFFFAWVFFFFSLVKHIRIIKSQPDLN